jgi:hypothetical protein
MSDLTGPCLLALFSGLISFWEYSRYRTVITPFGVTAWPYTLVVWAINAIAKHFGFFPVSLESILFVMGGLGFLMAGGFLSTILASQDESSSIIVKGTQRDLGTMLDDYRPLFIVLAIVSIAAGTIQLLLTFRQFGLAGVATDTFRARYGSGLLSHLMILSRPAFIFLFLDALYRKKRRLWILLAAMGIIVLMRQVKYHIIVMLLASFYLAYLHGLIVFRWKKVLLYGLAAYMLFNLSYTIGFSALGLGHAYSGKVQAFLFNHFFTYLFSGPIAFSEILGDPYYPLYSGKELLAVPINIFRALHEDQNVVNIIFHKWIPVSTIHRYFHSSNVFGMFGMLYAYVGTYATYLYVFVVGGVSYVLGGLARREPGRVGWQLLYVFMLGFLTLSFFGLYFNMLSFMEGAFYILFFPAFYRLWKRTVRRAWKGLGV